MSEGVNVHFACNHDNGKFSGRAVAFQFDVDGECELLVDHADLDLETGGVELTFGQTAFQVMGPERATAGGGTRREGLCVEARDRRRYVGSIVWDACWVELEAAIKLARFLIHQADFSVTEIATEGPFAFVESKCPHGRPGQIVCDVCSGRGIWAGVVDVAPEDVAKAMEGEFDDEENAS